MPTASSPRRRRLDRLRRVRRRVAKYLPYVVGVCLLLLIFLGYVAARGIEAGRDAAAASSAMTRAASELRDGNVSAARADAARATRLARSAERHTGGLAWQLATHVPGLRAPTTSTRKLTVVVQDVAQRVVAPIVELPGARPGSNVHGVAVDVSTFATAEPVVARAHARAEADLALLDSVTPIGVGSVDQRIDRARERLHAVAADLATLNAATELAPAMLSDGRRYLVLVQNNAESRATGGLVGAYALLHVARSSLVLDAAGPNNNLRDAAAPVIASTPAFDRRYGGLGVTTSWRSLNLTPDFPTAATVAAKLWQRQGLPQVDGVIAVDPPLLAQLLSLTGPVHVAGGPLLDSQNAVAYLEARIYADYPRAEDRARNRYLAMVTRAVFDTIRAHDVAGPALVRVLAKAVDGGHLQVWSAHADEEQVLASTRASGSLAARRAPFLEVVTQNLTGGKVDYYLRRSVSYVSSPAPTADNVGNGPVPMDDATVTVGLTNTAPARGLPPYVTLRADQPRSSDPLGSDRIWLSLYFAGGTGYTWATLDGRPIALHTDDEAGTSVMSTVLTLTPGATHVIRLHVLQPAPPGSSFTYVPQALAVPDQVVINRR